MLSKSLSLLPNSLDKKEDRVVNVRRTVVGKSIEEIMIKRNLANGLPLTNRIQEKSPAPVINNNSLESNANNQSKEKDRDQVLNSLMDYCRSLQNRIEV